MAVNRIQELLGLMQKNLECSICLELLTNPVATKCEHYFCRFCITEFLEKKRSVPCPLCKQPITKRSLREKAEICSIVAGVNNLISAFQEDSGTVFSPPKGPQSFFPCTPEAININPEGQKTRTKKNVRTSRRVSKAAWESTTHDSVVLDTFIVPGTLASSPNEKQSTMIFITSPSAAASSATAAKKSEGREDKTKLPPDIVQSSASSSSPSRGLLQYLNEGSCGKEMPGEDSPVQINLTKLDEGERPGRSTRSHQKRKTRLPDSSTTNDKEEPSFVVFDENQDKTGGSLTLDVAQMNEKNSGTQTDKENLIIMVNASPQKKSRGDQQKFGLVDSSQNSSETSTASTQNFLQLPVVTRTYGRSLERNVQNWIDALPSADVHEKRTNKHEQKNQHKWNNSCGKEAVNSTGNKTATEDPAPDTSVRVTVDLHLDEVNKAVPENEEASEQKEMNQESNTDVPQPCEKFILTPPVRRKPIFKRKDGFADGKDSLIHQQSPPSTDPYLFIVGNTPVSKSKKRGQRERKGKLLASPLLNKDVRKAVHFSDESRESERGQKDTNVVSANLDFEGFIEDPTCPVDAPVTEPLKGTWDLEKDSLFEAVDENLAVSAGSKTNTRSRSRPQNKSQNKKVAVAGGGHVKNRTGRKADSKGDNEEAQKMREEQTRELASWIGQAEDHALLFSTQEAQASIESMDEESGNEENNCYIDEEDLMEVEHTGVIAIAGEDDDDSNGGMYLVGPLPAESERPAKITASQQNRNFDAISFESKETTLVNQDKKQEVDESYSEGQFKTSLEGRKAEQLNKSKTTFLGTTEAKRLLSPAAPRKEQEHSALPSPLVGTSEMAENRADTESADNQLSDLEIPASSNIVLPSPMIGSILPKYSTPKMQNARQRRSGRGLTQHVTESTGNETDKYNKDEIPMNGNTNKEKEIDVANPAIHQHPLKSHKCSPDYLRSQKCGSATTSPLVTTIPSTYTEDACSGTVVVSPTPHRCRGKTTLAGPEGLETHLQRKSPEPKTLSLPPKPQMHSKTLQPKESKIPEESLEDSRTKEYAEDSEAVSFIPDSAEDESLSCRSLELNRSPLPSKSPATSKASKMPYKIQSPGKSAVGSLFSKESRQSPRESLRRKCVKTRSREHVPDLKEDGQLGCLVKYHGRHKPPSGKETAQNTQEDPLSVTVQVAVSSEVTENQIVSVELSVTAESSNRHGGRHTEDQGMDAALPLLEAEPHVEGHLNPEADDCSSSTDDLDINPDENEFEIPDMTLQSIEMQQSLPAGEPTQDCSDSPVAENSEALEQSAAACKNNPLWNATSKDSPISRSPANTGIRGSKLSGMQEHQSQERNMSSLEEGRKCKTQQGTPHSEWKMMSTLDSTITHVPETLELEKFSSNTLSPLHANCSTKENMKDHAQEETSVTFQNAPRQSKDTKHKMLQPCRGTDSDIVRGSEGLVESKPSNQSSITQASSTTATPSPSILAGVAAIPKAPAVPNGSHQNSEKPVQQLKRSAMSGNSQDSSPEQSDTLQFSSPTATPSSILQSSDEPMESTSPLFNTHSGKPAKLQDGAVMSEQSQNSSTDKNGTNQFSSISSSPSQSILQTVAPATGLVLLNTSVNHQCTTKTAEIESAIPEKQAKIESSVQGQDDVQPTVVRECITTKDQDLEQVQTLNHLTEHLAMDHTTAQQDKYDTEQRSPSKMDAPVNICAENEEDGSNANQDPDEKKRSRSKVLVTETQCPDTVEDQSISILLPEQCVADSLPDDIEPLNQPAGKEGHRPELESQAVDFHSNVSSQLQNTHPETSSTASPVSQSLPGADQLCSKQQEKNEDLPNEESKAVSLACLRKRNKHELGNESEVKLAKSPRSSITPALIPHSQSPSSSSDKVINSAPPCTTTVPLDSDDDDNGVLIVRRTKRKCFSLDGSPLKAATPLSTKRRKHGTRLTNLTGKFDKAEKGSGCESEVSSEHLDGNENKTEDKDDSCPILPQEHTHPEQGEPEMGAIENNEKVVSSEANEKIGQSDSVPNLSPMTRRKKTARGLTRFSSVFETESLAHGTEQVPGVKHDGQSSSSVQNGSAQSNMSPSQYVTKHQSKTRSQEKDGGADFSAQRKPASSPTHKAVLNEFHSKAEEDVETNLAKQRNSLARHVAVISDEEAMEVHENNSHEDESAPCKIAFSTRQARSTLDVVASDKNTGHHSQTRELSPKANYSDENAVIIIMESAKSQTQKPATQSSMPLSIDGTIPPSDFDLRFDDDDDNEEEEDAGVLEQEHGTQQSKTEQATTLNLDISNNESEMGPKSGHIRGAVEDAGTHAQQAKDGEILVDDENPENDDSSLQSPVEVQENRDQQLLDLSGKCSEEKADEEEEEMVVKKKGKRAVIDSDSDSDDNSGGESEASFQLNFTSSSALSSQSEIPTTQECSKMETELERLRREIAEVEAKLQGRSLSSRSDSVEDSCDMNSSRRHGKRGMKAHSQVQDSSDDETEELPGDRSGSSGKKHKLASRGRSGSQAKRSRRPRRISSDDDNNDADEEGEVQELLKQPRQQLMDAYVCEIKKDEAHSHSSPVHTPDSKVKGEVEMSDEDSNDLFLSPLSPSPPPPVKHSLARKESYAQPRSLFMADSPSLSNSATRIRPSLDFEVKQPSELEKLPAAADNMYTDIQDSQELNTEISGSLKNIPESQFSVSCTDESAQIKPDSIIGSGKVTADNDIESSGSPLPSPLKQRRLEPLVAGDDAEEKHNDSATVESDVEENIKRNVPVGGDAEKDKENIDGNLLDVTVDDEATVGDDDDSPRWKRKKFGFISSGLDSEKVSVLRRLAELNECKVYSKFNEKVTHVIMKTSADSRVCERTLKYFQGIAGRCWVLCFDWVLQSMQAGHFVPEKQYEILGDTVKGDNHRGPRSSRRSTFPLLEDFAFAAVGVSPDMSKKELNQLLTLTGADVVEDPWDLAGHAAKHKLVLRCVDSDTQPPTPAEIELFNGQYKHFRLVTVAREWILDSICTWSLQPLQDYVFNTCKDLSLPF